MYRKVTGNYEFENKDVVKGNIVLITIEDISKNSIEKTQIEYDLSQFDNICVDFHNKVIDDFDSEYDDMLADVIDTIINNIKKEVEER